MASWTGNSDNDSESLVAPSYLTDYHIHRPKKVDSLSGFQIKLMELAEGITESGTLTKLVDIANGSWLTPLQCAQAAVNEASGNEFPFRIVYRTLASANDNDIKLVNDHHLPHLQWQEEPQAQIHGSFFLHDICSKVFNLVIF